MSRGTWAKIRQSNRFYINTYRQSATALLVSLILNVFLGIAIYYLYSGQPEHEFYATDGVTPPVPLVPMDQPNESSTPLLPNEQNVIGNTNTAPQ